MKENNNGSFEKKFTDTNTGLGVKECLCRRCNTKYIVRNEKGLCPQCVDDDMFMLVKKTLEDNHLLTAVELSKGLDVPISKIKTWIEEGRLDYRK